MADADRGVITAAPAVVVTRQTTACQSVFSWLMMAPPLLFLAALVGYPFCYGILLSLQDRPVAHAGTFVGLKNFATNFNDPMTRCPDDQIENIVK